MLTGIEVNGKLMCINDAQQYLDGNSQITFHSNENNFTFLFSDNPQCGRLTARYAYQMEGVEKHEAAAKLNCLVIFHPVYCHLKISRIYVVIFLHMSLFFCTFIA